MGGYRFAGSAPAHGVLVLAVLLTSGCRSERLAGPELEPVVVNEVDHFELEAAGIAGVTETLEYTWMNTGATADVERLSSLTAGSGTVTMFDDAGDQMVDTGILEDGSSPTSSGSGAPGAWRIRVELRDVTGTVSFRVRKG